MLAALQFLFIFCMAFAAACGSDKPANSGSTEGTEVIHKQNKSAGAENAGITSKDLPAGVQNTDTLYRISGTEPFWSLVVAKPQIIFTSMEGDTLTFEYQEAKRAAGRPAEHVQVYKLGEQGKLILRKGTQCPCSDGMSDNEYPYQATLILPDRVLEGCGRSAAN